MLSDRESGVILKVISSYNIIIHYHELYKNYYTCTHECQKKYSEANGIASKDVLGGSLQKYQPQSQSYRECHDENKALPVLSGAPQSWCFEDRSLGVVSG